MMSSSENLMLSWSQFVIRYKLIKHIRQLSTHSFYGQHSLYLHLPTKSKVLVKEITFGNEDQFKYIVEQINEAAQFNECSVLCKLVKYTVRLDAEISGKIYQEAYLEKAGSILLLYQNQKSLEEIVKQMVNFSRGRQNANSNGLSGLSPSRYPPFAQSPHFNQHFSQKSLKNIFITSIHFVNFLQIQSIDSIKAITPQMLQIYHFGEIDQKCKYFLYPFIENQLLEMIKDNKIQIEQTFVGENILKLVNQEEQRSASKRSLEKSNIRDNHFANINLGMSPTFGPNHIATIQQEDMKNITIENLYTELYQSIGLLLTKLMYFSISKDKYLSSKLYTINSNYQLIINYDSIKSSLLQVKSLSIYSKQFISQVEQLLFNPASVTTFPLVSTNLSPLNKPNTSNPRNPSDTSNPRNPSVSKSTDKKSKEKSTHKSNKSPIKLTPSKKKPISNVKLQNKLTQNAKIQNKSISNAKIQNKSIFAAKLQNEWVQREKGQKKSIQLNQTLKEQKRFINPYLFDKSQSKSKQKHKSASFHLLNKTQSVLSFPQPKQFSPTIVTKESSNKKETLIQKPFSSNQKQPIPYDNNLPEAIVQKLKSKILYDKSGRLYPNMIEKKFRDGSTYYGQYNPQLNIKQGNGLYFYFQGDVYGGTWKNNQLNGLGIYYFANGDSYQGEVVNGEKEGLGVYHYANGNVYTGAWSSDKKQGEGHMAYANGDTYEGTFVDGRKQGVGMYTWLNGDTYEGTFVKNLKHGKGVFCPVHSHTFMQSLWQNDRIVDNSQAKIMYKDSNKVYQGTIRSNGTIEGMGRVTYDDNGTYEGSMKDNKLQGECVINYPNGDRYKGQIMNNQFEGYGEYFYASRKLTYAGFWHQGLQEGEGKLIDAQGTEIYSHWQKGKIGRKGVVGYQNKQRYEGEINEKGRHGEGKYYFSDNEWIMGRFENNALIQVYGTS